MNSPCAPLFPPALSESGRAQLEDELRKYRRRLISRQLAWTAQSPESAASEPLATRYLMAVAEEVADAGARAESQWLEHWGELFSILRLRSAPAQGECRLAARRNLAAGLALVAARQRRPAVVELELDVQGRMLDTRSGTWIRPPFRPGVPLIASAQDGEVALREAAQPEANATPLRGADSTEEAVPRLRDTRILLFDDPAALGLPLSTAESRFANFASFVESVTCAMETLGALAPRWRDWIEALVPALVCMGGPPVNSDSRSASFGAGFPVCLSHVRHPFRHAEDLVHECQHHRFHLWAQNLDWSTLSVTECSFVSPYRGDPRPLYGLHMGLHAFTTVNQLRFEALDAEMVGGRQLHALLRTHCNNLFAWATLSEFEQVGGDVKRYLKEAAAALIRHHALLTARVPAAVIHSMRQSFREHVDRVSRRCAGARNSSAKFTDWGATLASARDYVGSDG